MTTRSASAIILLVVVIVVATLIWYPFFKTFEKQKLEEEAADAAA